MQKTSVAILLAISAFAAACGDDDENKNPLAPSMMGDPQAANVGQGRETQSGISAGALPVAGPSSIETASARSAAPAACIPNPAIVAAAERNRQANNRPPGFGRSWKQLLVFFGEDWPGHDPVTLAEMDARVGRWAGWRRFRDEVARLIDCGWTAPGSVQGTDDVGSGGNGGGNGGSEPEDTPMPQQAPEDTPEPAQSPGTVTYEPAGATIPEGEYLRIRFSATAEHYCIGGSLPDWLTGVTPLGNTNLNCTPNNPILLATRDDNAVGPDRTFSLRPYTDAPDVSYSAQTLTVTEDDLLQVNLRPGSHDGNDYGTVDLDVYRDHEGPFSIELVATGAARIGNITAAGNVRSANGNHKKKITTYGNGLEAQRDAVRTIAITCADNSEGWIEARGVSGTRATTDRERVCNSGSPPPAKTGGKISGFATATFPVRMSCSKWSDTHGGADRSIHSEFRDAGWSPLYIEPRISITVSPFPTHDATHPRVCNVDIIQSWSALGGQTAQVRCTVGETMVAALDGGTLTNTDVIERIRDYFARPYRAFCLN